MSEAARLLAHGDQPSIDAIARAAGVSRTTFYRAFPSRADLLAELRLEPEPDTRRRVLDAAAQMLKGQTLAELSMDELAAASHISRANLYRLYPGKAALFREMLVVYSPFEPAMELFGRMGDRPPEEFIPQLVLTAYRTVAAQPGIARTILLQVTTLTPETQQPFADTGLRVIAMLAAYLQSQMQAGRLRTMHPLLALQSLVGSVMMHVLSAPVLGSSGAFVPAGEEAVVQLAQLWLRGMRPEA